MLELEPYKEQSLLSSKGPHNTHFWFCFHSTKKEECFFLISSDSGRELVTPENGSICYRNQALVIS